MHTIARLSGRLLTLGVFLTLFLEAQTPLPDAKGKAEFERICSACHDLTTATNVKRTKEEWDAVIDDMQGRGATGSDKELNLVAEYLNANFGKKKPN